ncbi:phosphatidylserine decarboxylase-domain-containing protein [Mycena polygramma]|nr:phosphatidylserine decarboxylase-domain-containing protein [Mycena polygramma]
MASCFGALPNPFQRFTSKSKTEDMPADSPAMPAELHFETDALYRDESEEGKMTNELAAQGLDALVKHSDFNPQSNEGSQDVSHSIHASSHTLFHIPSLQNLIPGIENGLQRLAAKYHVGNYVAIRGSKTPIFETMPIYARIGMHLLFYGRGRERVLNNESVEQLLKRQSEDEGKVYDNPKSAASIPSFIRTYNLGPTLNELLKPITPPHDPLKDEDWNVENYPTFNHFFFRQLKPNARPVEKADDPHVICSAADCRLTVYPDIALAREFWIKGDQFTIPKLLDPKQEEDSVPVDLQHDKNDLDEAKRKGPSLAIFRLAPADYHRFHSPIDGTIEKIFHIDGQYYTVNPQAVNEPKFDVFTANTRSIMYITHEQTGKTVAFVAIGALLVGSIEWTKKQGDKIKRGEELGFFKYGGSTVVVAFPQGAIEFDADLVANSEGKNGDLHVKGPIETLVKVGNSIGRTKLAGETSAPA